MLFMITMLLLAYNIYLLIVGIPFFHRMQEISMRIIGCCNDDGKINMALIKSQAKHILKPLIPVVFIGIIALVAEIAYFVYTLPYIFSVVMVWMYIGSFLVSSYNMNGITDYMYWTMMHNRSRHCVAGVMLDVITISYFVIMAILV